MTDTLGGGRSGALTLSSTSSLNRSRCLHEDVDTHAQKVFITSGCQGNMGHRSLSYVLTSQRWQETEGERNGESGGGEIKRTKEQMGSRSSGDGEELWHGLISQRT